MLLKKKGIGYLLEVIFPFIALVLLSRTYD